MDLCVDVIWFVFLSQGYILGPESCSGLHILLKCKGMRTHITVNLSKRLGTDVTFYTPPLHFFSFTFNFTILCHKRALRDTSVLHIPRSTPSDLTQHVDVETQALPGLF